MKKLTYIINIILLGLLYGGILIITDNINIPKEQLNMLLIVGITSWVAYNYLHIIIHETGHLIFGLISGYKFVSFRIANIMLIKDNNKFKLKKFSLLGTGGQCLMEPPKLKNGKIPVILYNLGGVIMNFIISILVLILAHYINIPLLKYSLEIFALIGIYYAVLNGLPLSAEINTDGLNAILLARNKDAQKSFWIQLMVNAEQTKGKRTKDMPNEWFYMPTDEEMKNNMTATLGVLYCGKLLDEHKFKETKEAIIKVLKFKEQIAGVHRYLLITDRIYCEILEGNLEKANKLLTESQKKFMHSMKNFPSVIRTEYAIEKIINKNVEESEKILNNFENIKEKYPYKKDIELEEELINIIKNKK